MLRPAQWKFLSQHLRTNTKTILEIDGMNTSAAGHEMEIVADVVQGCVFLAISNKDKTVGMLRKVTLWDLKALISEFRAATDLLNLAGKYANNMIDEAD